jgi:hypothetical protein
MKAFLHRLFGGPPSTVTTPLPDSPGHNDVAAASAQVPAALRERLRKHPAHIQRLQQALSSVSTAGRESIPRFELAVWALEGRLGSFLSEARDELDAARAAGDRKEVKRAEANVRLMSEIRLKQVWIGDTALWNHFGKPEGSAP